MLNLHKDAKLVRINNAAAAAQTAVETSIVDMSGYDSVLFIVALGTVTNDSILTLKAQSATTNSGGAMADVTGATTAAFTAATSSNKVIVLDVHKISKQYVRAVFTRTAQNAALDGVFALLYNSKAKPVTADASVISSATVVGV